MKNKEEIKDVYFASQEEINKGDINTEGDISPFRIYEETYCNKCEDYRGCLGLIDSMTMALQDSKPMTGNESLDNMVKSLGGLTFSARFNMILNCARLRDIVSKVK